MSDPAQKKSAPIVSYDPNEPATKWRTEDGISLLSFALKIDGKAIAAKTRELPMAAERKIDASSLMRSISNRIDQYLKGLCEATYNGGTQGLDTDSRMYNVPAAYCKAFSEVCFAPQSTRHKTFQPPANDEPLHGKNTPEGQEDFMATLNGIAEAAISEHMQMARRTDAVGVMAR